MSRHLFPDGVYDDGGVRVDDLGVMALQYWFPHRMPVRVTWSELRGHERRPAGGWVDRLRMSLTHRREVRTEIDRGRPAPDEIVRLRVRRGIDPIITPLEPATVCRLIDERLGRLGRP